MNILITGSNGHIGQRLMQFLLPRQHRLNRCVKNWEIFAAEYGHLNIYRKKAKRNKRSNNGIYNRLSKYY